MSPFLQLIFVLAVILFAAKLAGYLSTRVGQPSVLGELLVGIILGPSLVDLTHLFFISDRHLGEVVFELGELGVLLLIFIAGLELHVTELARNARVSAYAGVLGVIVPVGLGWLAGTGLGLDNNQAVFLGLALGATSVSISAQTLIELKALRSRVGLGLLGAAVFDDILIILILSAFLALMMGFQQVSGLLLVVGKIALFLGLSVGFGMWVLPLLVRKIARLPISFGLVTLSVVIMMLYGFAAEMLGGMAAITGTFLAGLMFSRTPARQEIQTGLNALAYSFFVPIFFTSIGMSINLRELGLNSLWITLGISLIAIVGKVIGAGGGAYLARLDFKESVQLGIGMVSRGEVGLIVARLGQEHGLFGNNVFSAVVGMVLVTTLVTPPLLRAAFSQTARIAKAANVADCSQKEVVE